MVDKTLPDLAAATAADITAATQIFVYPSGGPLKRATAPLLADFIAGAQPWPYLSGEYYEPDGVPGDFISTAAQAVGSYYAVIGHLHDDVTIANLCCRTTATVNAAGQARLGIASVNPATMKPLTLLGETAAFAVGTASTNYEAALAGGNTLVPRGLVALLSQSSHATTYVAPQLGLANASYGAAAFGSSTLAGIFTNLGRIGWSASGQTFGAYPSNLGALTWAEDGGPRSAKVKFRVA